MDWGLLRRVALIPDDTWDAGPEAVAEAIADIRKDLAPKPLNQKELATHIERLLASPDMSELAAESAAESIEKSIHEFKTQAPANKLPDGLETLEDLPAVFRSIKSVIISSKSKDEKIASLQEEINDLHSKVQKLEAELKEAQQKTLTGVFKKKYIETLATTLGSAWFKGAVCLGACHFFGVAPSDITLENLRDYLDQASKAEPISDDRPLPPIDDI